MSKSSGESPQVAAWRSRFGDAYIDRNADTGEAVRIRAVMWKRILKPLAETPPRHILEVGSNIGLNLRAIAGLTPAALYAVEPNRRAREVLIESGVVPAAHAMDGTADRIPLGDGAVDLAFTCGVLIHVHPDDLSAACAEIHRVARRHVAVAEYFSAVPETVAYRGREDLLFKRDFGSFWCETFPDLEVVDYGFFWKPGHRHRQLDLVAV